MPDVAAIVLAAGKASRFRGADPAAPGKLTTLYRGEPMVRHAARAALASDARPVIVVTGCDAALVRAALAGLDVAFVHNRDYETGIASSLRAGLTALGGQGDGALVLLGDMPMVGPDLLRTLIAAFGRTPQPDAVVPVHDGVRGNPALLARRLFSRAMDLDGDEGARRLLRDRALDVAEVEADAAAAIDIDTPQALRDADKGE